MPVGIGVSSSSGTKFLITGSTINLQQAIDPTAFDKLCNHICVAAFHNSDVFDEVKCHPGTRTALLKGLEMWSTSPPDDDENPLYWVNGPAGAGKTAIANSLAEICEGLGALAAAFFFRRTDPGRSDERRFIPTLAYQLALSIPQLRPFIEAEIFRDPALFHRSIAHQIIQLILNSFHAMKSVNPDINFSSFPRLIIVDGLDECGGLDDKRLESQYRILEVLRRLGTQQAIFPFRILIFSRPERYLHHLFDQPSFSSITHRIRLDESFSPEDDIFIYVNHEFLWITTGHPDRHSLPPGWPPCRTVQRIVERSSGQFIYAATVMKFIKSLRHRPAERLRLIEEYMESMAGTLSQEFPLANLHTLYRDILSTSVDPSSALRAITFHLVHPTISTSNIAIPLLSVEKMLFLTPGAIRHSLSDFESVLEVLDTPQNLIKFHHASFVDFLHDSLRAGDWYINVESSAEQFVLDDLEMFENPHSEDERAFWFYCFCDAVQRATPSSRLRSHLLSRWSDVVSYDLGREFLKTSWLGAGKYYDLLRLAYSNMKFTDNAVLVKGLEDGFLHLLQPYLVPYLSDVSLLALLLSHITDPFPLAGRSKRRWLKDFFESLITTQRHLFNIDQTALHLLGTPHLDTFWLRSLFATLYHPKKGGMDRLRDLIQNDVLLMDATHFLLELIKSRRSVSTMDGRPSGQIKIAILAGSIMSSLSESLSIHTKPIVDKDLTLPSPIREAFMEGYGRSQKE